MKDMTVSVSTGDTMSGVVLTRDNLNEIKSAMTNNSLVMCGFIIDAGTVTSADFDGLDKLDITCSVDDGVTEIEPLCWQYQLGTTYISATPIPEMT